MSPRTPSITLAALLAVLPGVSCAPARRAPPAQPRAVDAGTGNRDWYAGTPEMQARIRELIASIPSTSGAERVRVGRLIVAHGEPAVPQLVQALRAPDSDTRGTAAWLLGFLGDPRTADALVLLLADPVPSVRYEAAASLLRMGDDRGVETLLRGLEDDDPLVRAKCILLLEERTGEDFGYRADLDPVERGAAVARWRAWAAGRAGAGG